MSFINSGNSLIIIRSGSIIRIWPIGIIITTFLYNIFNLGEKKTKAKINQQKRINLKKFKFLFKK